MGKSEDKNILIIDFCNYEDYQIGGFLSLAKNLISAFGDTLSLIGITTDKNDKVGRWTRKRINDVDFNFFALARYNKHITKHFLPDRLVCFLLLRYYRRRILQLNFKNVFVQRHEVLPAIKDYGYKNICYCFPGLENPIRISKYWFGKYLATFFDKIFFSSFKNVNLILASGDEKSIEEMVQRSKGAIEKSRVIIFPTRINTDIYRPLDKQEVRKRLSIPDQNFVISTTGRLAWFKGWKFMIDCFILFEKIVPHSYLYFIGDGEDHQRIQEYISQKQISDKVILSGRKNSYEISLYLNASDLFIMGSYNEGWSTSLSEAIACGIPSCVTNFSSAKEIILEGKNGYVIEEHKEDLFVQGMVKAMKLARPVYNENVLAYSTDKLKEDLLKLWKLI